MVAKGFEPTFFAKTDPLKGSLEAKLKKRMVEGIPPKNILLGRVVDKKKEPVPHAVVSVEMTQQGNTGRGSPPVGTDPIAITDEEGNFALYSKEPFDHMTLKVTARAMAPLRFNEVRPGPTRRELVVTEGAALRGRVLLNGKPVKDLAVGAVSVDRSENFSGDYEYATNEEGVFYFPNLPPNRPYYVYGMINSTMKYGALPAKQVEIKGDGTTADVGDLKIVPGFRLVGEVRLADGKPLPQPTRLSIGRREAWDVYTVELGPDGKFDLTNMPPESITAGAGVQGYRHSGKNRSLDRLNPFGLSGMLASDKTNLVILLEPGEMLPSEWTNEEASQRPENRPIAGIEDGGWTEKKVFGRIIDENSDEPVTVKVRVKPGYPRGRDMRFIDWQNSRSVTAESGSYELNLPSSRTNVVLQVLAEDYAPHLSKSLTLSSTNLEYNVTLAPAKSPSGTLLGVDGKPASGMKMYILGPMEQGYLGADGDLRIHQAGEESKCVTDADGQFKFPPKPGEAEIFVATKEGFARVLVKELSEKIQLKPYGKVRGRLLKDGKPVAEEPVDLAWEQNFNPNHPHIGLHGTITDADGNFHINTVPVAKMKVTRREKMDTGSSWTNHEIKKFETRPGELLDLGDIEYPPGTLTRRR